MEEWQIRLLHIANTAHAELQKLPQQNAAVDDIIDNLSIALAEVPEQVYTDHLQTPDPYWFRKPA